MSIRDEVITRIESYSKPNSKGAEGQLARLEEAEYDIDDARSLLDAYVELDRSDFDSAEDYREGRAEAWDEFVQSLHDIEEPEAEVEDDIEAEEDEDSDLEVEDEDVDGEPATDLDEEPADEKPAKRTRAATPTDGLSVTDLATELDIDGAATRRALRSIAKKDDRDLFVVGETGRYSWSKKEFAEVVKTVRKHLEA